MKIAIDYDKTWTADPHTFASIADNFSSVGHEVYIVTARSATKDYIGIDGEEAANYVPDAIDAGWIKDVIYCDGVAKKWALHHYHDLDIDIWIDDKPQSILENSTATKEILKEWRANGRV